MTQRPAWPACLTWTAALVLLAACADAADRRTIEADALSAVGALLDTTSMIRHATTGAPHVLDRASAHVVEELRIGVTWGAEPYELHEAWSLDVTPDGRIFLVNRATHSIRVFAPTGEFLREMGGEGPGPYEFRDQSPLLRVFVAGDSVVAAGRDRVAVFDTLGRPRVSWSALKIDPKRPGTDGYDTTRRTFSLVGRTDAGWLALRDTEWRPHTGVRGRRYQDTLTFVFVDVVDGDSVGRVLHTPGTRTIGSGVNGESARTTRLWEPQPRLVVGRNGRLYHTGGDSYQIDEISLDGRVQRRIPRDVTPVPLTSAHLDRYRQLVLAYIDTGDAFRHYDRRQLRRVRETRAERIPDLGHAAELSPIGRFLVSRDGALWVARPDLNAEPARDALERRFSDSGYPDAANRASHWDRFDRHGTFIGAIELPPRFAPHVVEGERVYGIARDEDDVERLVRYRVVPGSGDS